jgi:hypothetical protein
MWRLDVTMLMCHEREVTCVTKKEVNDTTTIARVECHVSLPNRCLVSRPMSVPHVHTDDFHVSS